ncbi:transposable element p transposase, partial [Lasius niger]
VHFTSDEWVNNDRTKLKKNAVPTVFCRCPTLDKENSVPTNRLQRKRGRPSKESNVDHTDFCPMKKVFVEHDYYSRSNAFDQVASSPPNSNFESSLAKTSLETRDEQLFSPPNTNTESSLAVCLEARDDQISSIETIPIPDSLVELPSYNHLDLEDPCNLDKFNKIMKENSELRHALNCMKRDRDNLKKKLHRTQKRYKNLCFHTSKRFENDQLDALSKGGHLRGLKWSDKTVLKALRIHFASSTVGYELISSTQMPLPCVRVLQNRMQHLKFSPGILQEIFQVLPAKINNMASLHKHCMLSFDEMSIKEALEFDTSTNTYIGYCTVPAAKPRMGKEYKARFNNDPILIEKEREKVSKAAFSSKATKAMTFILGGVAKRWKQTVCYELTGNSFCAEAVKKILIGIIKKCHDVGLVVRAIVSDMGNRSVWTAFGINQFVTEFQLPSNWVKLDHLKTLCKFQENMRWKLAPGLSEDYLLMNHFGKMKVGNASRIFNPRVAAALNFLSYLPNGESEMRTTAWFIKMVYTWFKNMTARIPIQGLGKKNPEAFAATVRNLNLTMDVFQTMKVGHEWKPCQTGVKAATLCILDLSTFYLDEVGLNFFLPGRFTSDICENLFSAIRYKRPNPSALQFKQRLKTCSISQFMKHNSKSSYDLDDRSELLNLLDAENMKISEDIRSLNSPSLDEEEEIILACLSAQVFYGLESIPENDKYVFYRVCGYIVNKLREEKPSFRECNACLQACRHNSSEPHRYGKFNRMTNFKDGALFEVSNDVFELLLSVEEKIMAIETFLHTLKCDLLKLLEDKVCTVTISPTSPLNLQCHNISQEIIHRYIKMRVKLMSEKPSECHASKAASSQLSSMSMGSRYLANKFHPSQKK